MKIPTRKEMQNMCFNGNIPEEFREWQEAVKAHWCGDWDDMLVTRDCPEFESCHCFPLREKKQTYQFEICFQLKVTEQQIEDLYAVGCDDALVSFRNDETCISFAREHINYIHAVCSALKDIQMVIDIEKHRVDIIALEPCKHD